VALPDADRTVAPDFAHHADLPVITERGLRATVLMGELAGAVSPARTFSPLVGAEIVLAAGTDTQVPTRTDFEYAALVLDGAATVDGVPVKAGPLLYLGRGRPFLRVQAGPETRLMVLGGEPFEERLVMWWNFVARDHDEIVRAREEWAQGSAFGVVHGYEGPAMPAPPMPISRLLPRGRVR
jgi:redox-sensitive bicupin YhaK (pirin superfamily)